MISRIFWTIAIALVARSMILMTIETYLVRPLGVTMWFAFVAFIACLCLLMMLGDIKNVIVTARINKAKKQANYERVYLTEFQKSEY